MNTPRSTLVMRDLPLAGWIIGILLVGFAGLNLMPGANPTIGETQIIFIVLGVAGLAVLLFSPVLTVTADRDNQMLTLHHRSPVTNSLREIPFSQIDAIELQMGSGSRRGGPTYRIAVMLKDGDAVPFHSYYSSGSGAKTRKVKQLREFIGVGGSEMGMGLLGTLRAATQMAQSAYQKQQEEMTGSQDTVHTTDGVSWQVQTRAFGGAAVTRWFTPDFQVSGGFVYVTQMVEGQKMSSAGVLGGLSNMLFQQAMRIYGFGSEDTPGSAALLDEVNPLIAPNFGVYTSVPDRAQQILSPRAASLLADWARRYPLKQFQTQQVFGQLVVMFSPQGVYVASMGTMIPEAIEEMTRLGVGLVKAQDQTVGTYYGTPF